MATKTNSKQQTAPATPSVGFADKPNKGPAPFSTIVKQVAGQLLDKLQQEDKVRAKLIEKISAGEAGEDIARRALDLAETNVETTTAVQVLGMLVNSEHPDSHDRLTAVCERCAVEINNLVQFSIEQSSCHISSTFSIRRVQAGAKTCNAYRTQFAYLLKANAVAPDATLSPELLAVVTALKAACSRPAPRPTLGVIEQALAAIA